MSNAPSDIPSIPSAPPAFQSYRALVSGKQEPRGEEAFHAAVHAVGLWRNDLASMFRGIRFQVVTKEQFDDMCARHDSSPMPSSLTYVGLVEVDGFSDIFSVYITPETPQGDIEMALHGALTSYVLAAGAGPSGGVPLICDAHRNMAAAVRAYASLYPHSDAIDAYRDQVLSIIDGVYETVLNVYVEDDGVQA